MSSFGENKPENRVIVSPMGCFIVLLIFGAGTRIRWGNTQRKRNSLRSEVILHEVKTNMSDSEEPSDEEQRVIKQIDKEIDKVK